MKKCYNCGVLFSKIKKTERTKEHIPAKALFDGYPQEYLANRKTVPACSACNQAYSKIDSQIRDLIGVKDEADTEKKGLVAKTFKSILRNPNKLNEKIIIANGKYLVKFEIHLIEKLHIKNFKGIYTITTKNPLPYIYKLDVYSEGQSEDKLNLGLKFIKKIKMLGNWNVSGHQNVFKYKMVAILDDSLILQEYDAFNENFQPKYIMCAIQYNLICISVKLPQKNKIDYL